MRNSVILLVIILAVGIGLFYKGAKDKHKAVVQTPSVQTQLPKNPIKVIAENLDIPWGLAFLPDGRILLTERSGRVGLIRSDGVLESSPVITIEEAQEISEGGLLGITLHPDFSSNNYVYLYYTYEGNQNQTFNRVVRMTYKDRGLEDEQIIVDNIPGAPNHNGGRIKFGPDNFLYITTGDAQNPSLAQDTSSLAGKILRVTDTGANVSDNPFNNPVYSYGHRNSQGIIWDKNGRLWATEHGRSGVLSGLDEINLIEKGKNYGWPIIQGDEEKFGMETSALNSGDDTWAPAGAAFVGNSLFFAGLRGEALYQAIVNGKEIRLKQHFKGEFGRLRDVVLGPDGMLYITTSNRDGRGKPSFSDDRVIRVNPKEL